MIIVKAPFRLSLFGGSTDYESFYKEHGSLLIGTTIDKYIYTSFRFRPSIVSDMSVISYSKQEVVSDIKDIKHPLIREILKRYSGPDQTSVDIHMFSDIPSRTGLGGSSTFCVSILYALWKEYRLNINKKKIATEAICIEREILKEPGGIQDQIWASYGGLNSIEITTNGEFFVRPLPVSYEFKKLFEDSLILVYTNDQRTDSGEIAKSHDNKDKTKILELSKTAYNSFLKEDLKEIGTLLLESWKEKQKISSLISNNKINEIAEKLLTIGAYGVKLLGSGGCGFVLGICDPKVKEKAKEIFNKNVLDVKLEFNGVTHVYFEPTLNL